MRESLRRRTCVYHFSNWYFFRVVLYGSSASAAEVKAIRFGLFGKEVNVIRFLSFESALLMMLCLLQDDCVINY